MELAIAIIAMVLITVVGAYAVLNDEEVKPPKTLNKTDRYFKDVQSMRAPPRKVSDDEISPYQGFGGAKQEQRAQSRKRTQVRRKESSIWDNLAPKEYHTILNVILAFVFAVGLIVVTFVS